jgi:hypothetical protein
LRVAEMREMLHFLELEGIGRLEIGLGSVNNLVGLGKNVTDSGSLHDERRTVRLICYYNYKLLIQINYILFGDYSNSLFILG